MDTAGYIKTALMPLSQAYGWYKLSKAKDSNDVFNTTLQMSAFYGSWALYKILVEKNKKERAHISMGLTFVSSLMRNKYATLLASSVVVLNYAVPTAMILPMSTAKLAEVAGKGKFDKDKPIPTSIKVWAVTFKTYFVSSIFFWSTAVYKLQQA